MTLPRLAEPILQDVTQTQVNHNHVLAPDVVVLLLLRPPAGRTLATSATTATLAPVVCICIFIFIVFVLFRDGHLP